LFINTQITLVTQERSHGIFENLLKAQASLKLKAI